MPDAVRLCSCGKPITGSRTLAASNYELCAACRRRINTRRRTRVTPEIIPTVDDRWTVRGVDPELVQQLRILAIRRGTTVGELLNEALNLYLTDPRLEARAK